MRSLASLSFAIWCLTGATDASGLSLEVVRIVGPEIRSPDGDGFVALEAMGRRGDGVLLWGITEGDVWGAYEANADSLVPLIEDRPGDGFNGLILRSGDEDGEVIYSDSPTIPSVQSLYVHRPDSLELIARGGWPAPGGGSFGAFGEAALEGDDVAFLAGPTSAIDVYLRHEGTIALIAGGSTIVPGFEESGFTFFQPQLVNGRVYFGGGTGDDPFNVRAGIYSADGGDLSVVVDTTREIPGRNETFDGFGPLSTDGERFLFGGYTTGPGGFPQSGGLYLLEDGVIQTIADSTTLLPGDAGSFAFSSHYFLGEDFVLFGNNGGIYMNRGGEIVELVARGGSLDLGVISYAYLGEDALSGDTFSFIANAERGRAIYVARIVPEPGTALLLGLGLAVAASAHRASAAR